MNGIFVNIINNSQLFLLILVRMTGLFFITPIFSRRNIPNTIKIGLSLFCAIILVNIIQVDLLNLSYFDLFLFIVRELLVGLIMGFISYLFFSSLYIAGQVIDMQIGFGMVNVLDPQSNTQVPIIGNLYYIIALFIFMIIDGHHWLLDALVRSYEYIPIGYFEFSDQFISQLIRIISQVFIIGFKISGPILAAIFLVDVLLGIFAKTIPQMNVFIVGMPLKILVGIAIIIITLPLFFSTLQYIFSNMYEEIFSFLKTI